VSTLLALFIFHVITPGAGGESRRVFMAVPPTLLIAAQGLVWLRERMPNPSWALVPSVSVVLLVCLFSFPPAKKPRFGFERVAEFIIAKPEWRDCVALISSEHGGEGHLISEVAVRENAPQRYLLRANKMLASSYWGGEDYKMRFETAGDLSQYLDQSPIGLIVIDKRAHSPLPMAHHELLWSVLRSNGDWEKVQGFSQAGLDGGISIYKHKTKACVPNPKIEVDLTRKIDRSVSSKP
jgi:hypothetical protein